MLAVFVSVAMSALPGTADGPRVEVVATGLEVPWSLAFAEDGRLFVTEQPGHIRVVRHGRLERNPVATIAVAPKSSGLMGLALDPAFATNGHLYVCYMAPRGEGLVSSRLVRLTLRRGAPAEERLLLDGHRGVGTRNGCRVKIGPDGKLYATMGDAGEPRLARRLRSPAGKILRLNRDGTVPADNPFPGSAVYALGFRNPQGLAWDAAGQLYATEHGPIGRDEINLIQPGGDYGWPNVLGRAGHPRFIDPVIESGTDTWAPAGAAILAGAMYVATLRGQCLLRVSLPRDRTAPRLTSLLKNAHGRLRDVVVGPDGALYVTTSNRDFRGTPTPGDDHILRIVP